VGACQEYFSELFRAPSRCPIEEIIKVVSLILIIVVEEMNDYLQEGITDK
jgi:hypothetical protein